MRFGDGILDEDVGSSILDEVVCHGIVVDSHAQEEREKRKERW